MIDFGGRKVGAGHPVLIVAELGTSHQGDPGKAREMVDAAARGGADCVKLQLVYADEILHPLSGEVELPTGRVELYHQFKSLEKDISFYREVKEYAEKRKLLFLCSAFGIQSARALSSLGVRAIKIASPELNHFPLLKEASTHGVPLILSSGVSKLGDIERALETTGRNVVLLHCVTAYPAPEEDYNLRLLGTLRGIFGVEVGVSDHSLDPVLVPALAVLNGACIIEKHFTLSRSGSGLDDPIALEPKAFGRMVRRVRETESAVSGGNGPAARAALEREYGARRVDRVEGSGVKELAASEKSNYIRTNRSIHALIEIPEGAVIRAEATALLRTEKKLRPGIGPEFLSLVIGANAKRRIPAGEGIVWEDII
jgi:sialic acid synthase SpsE